jgi:hypothetical protein
MPFTLTEYSGINGAIDGIPIADCDLSYQADDVSFVNALTRGATARRSGNKDWSGGWRYHGHTPVKLPGDTFTFSATPDKTAGTQKGFTGPAIVDEVTVKWDIEGGKVIEHSGKFSGTGAYTLGTVTVAADTSIPNPPTAVGTKMQTTTVGGSSWVELQGVRTMEFTMRRPPKEFAHAGTAGCKGRRKGNLDASLSVSIYADADLSSQIPALNAVNAARLFVDATLYWEIKWFKLLGVSGLKIDVETGALLGATLNFGWDAIADQGSPALGSIITPASATLWPPA